MIFVDFEVLMLLYLDQVSTADSKKKMAFLGMKWASLFVSINRKLLTVSTFD